VPKRSLLLSNNFFAPTVMMLRRDVPIRFLAGRRHVGDDPLWPQFGCAGLRLVRLSARLPYTYKAPVGQIGLSSRLWQIEQAEFALADRTSSEIMASQEAKTRNAGHGG